MAYNRDRHNRWPGWLRAIALSLALAGCAAPFQAGPLGPHTLQISNLQLRPERTTAGCPLMVRFDFEDSGGDIIRANAHWSLDQSNKRVASAYVTLAMEPAVFSGKRSGQASAQLVLGKHGTYWVHVQVEDAGGFKSNVLKGAVLMDAPIPWKNSTCDSQS